MNLKQRIKDKGIKQSWIADKLEISPALLHHYLTGRTPIPPSVENKIKRLIG